jgi:lysozyme
MQRRRVFLLLPLALAACSGTPDEGERLGEVQQADTVCASGETVDGIDVSRWQEGIDWQAVAASGVKFATARAAYGTTKDMYFDANWAGMKESGIIRGAYQWFLPDEDPIAQAQFLLDVMGPLEPYDLPPVVDVEDTGGQSASIIVSKLSQWMAHVEAAIGRKPIIYTGKYFWQDYVGGSDAFVDHPLWIPNYSASCPNLPNGGWTDWTFFQYTDSGSVPGISGNVDLDFFNGSYEELLAFAGGGYAAEFVSQSFPYAADAPLVLEAGETFEVHIELRNAGGKPWNDSTMLATTEPRDRASAFFGPDWIAESRPAAVEGAVLPGESYHFTFTLHAPDEPGVYSEYFGVVQEGETWFSDPGNGGPPDDQLQGVFEVVAGPGSPGSSSATTGSGGASPPKGVAADAEAGCATSLPTQGGWGWLAALAVLLGIAMRRRRWHALAAPLLLAGCADEAGGVPTGSSGAGGAGGTDAAGGSWDGSGGDGGEAMDPPDDPMCEMATTPCDEYTACCGDLVCGMTTLGQVCCGNQGASCATENGEDCCDDLLCLEGMCVTCEGPCTQPPALVLEKERLFAIGGTFLGICGDSNHTYGYHVPSANLPSSDYSMQGSANAPVCDWYASAIDIGMDWPASRDWLKWLIPKIAADEIQGIAEVIGSYDGVNVRYWSDSSGWSTNGIPYQGSGHASWTHVAIDRSTAHDDHGILAGWTANGGP